MWGNMSSHFIHIEPSHVTFKRARPIRIYKSTVFYLGYNRNAWHSTWISRYYPNSVSGSMEDLKATAETRRVPGSVFKIQALPLLLMRFRRKAICLCPINELSGYEYDQLERELDYQGISTIWDVLPSSKRNWLLTFQPVGKLNKNMFTPLVLNSTSFGINYKLSWSEWQGASLRDILSISSLWWPTWSSIRWEICSIGRLRCLKRVACRRSLIDSVQSARAPMVSVLDNAKGKSCNLANHEGGRRAGRRPRGRAQCRTHFSISQRRQRAVWAMPTSNRCGEC